MNLPFDYVNGKPIDLKNYCKMTLQQKLSDLKRFYIQKEALLKHKNSDEYNEKQYTDLMNFYNETIKRKRAELNKIDKNLLLKFDTDRANETTITKGIEYLSS